MRVEDFFEEFLGADSVEIISTENPQTIRVTFKGYHSGFKNLECVTINSNMSLSEIFYALIEAQESAYDMSWVDRLGEE